MKGAGSVVPENGKRAASRCCAVVSSKRATKGGAQQSNWLSVKVVSLEKAVVKPKEKVTWMKEDNALLSAHEDAHSDV